MISADNTDRPDSPANQPPTASKTQPGLSTIKKRRKLGRPDELVAEDIYEKSIIEDPKPKSVVRKKLSFLPKINLEDVSVNAPKSQLKKNRLSLQKKLAIFKVKRHAIEGKNFQNLKRKKRKANLSKTALRKKSLKRKLNRSNDIIEILDTSEEPISILNEHSKWKNNEICIKNTVDMSNIVFKELYVNLVPLEKTNLLNKKQMLELKVKKKKNYSNSKPSSKSYGKENVCEIETPKGKNRCLRQVTSVNCSKIDIVPCKVIIERISAEQMKMLTMSKRKQAENDINENDKEQKLENSMTDSNSSENNNNKHSFIDKAKQVDTNKHTNPVVLLEKIPNKMLSSIADSKSVENNDVSVFSPVISSSPLITHALNVFLKPLTPGKYLTYNLEANQPEDFEMKSCTSEIEIKNDTICKINESDSEEIRRNFAELPHIFDADSSLDDPVDKSRSKFVKSCSTKNLTYEGNSTYIPIKKSGTFTKSPSAKNLTYEVEINQNGMVNDDKNLPFDQDLTFTKESPKFPDVSLGVSLVKQINYKSKSLPSNIAQIRGRNSISRKRRHSCYENTNENDSPSDIKQQKLTPQKRRSTFTLEESVNNITLLKSVCDTSDTSLKKNEHTELESLVNITNNAEHSKKSQLDYSNVTFRRSRNFHSNDFSLEMSRMLKGNASTSSSFLESTSPPWDETNFVIDKTTSKENTPKSSSTISDEHDESCKEDKGQSDEETMLTLSSTSLTKIKPRVTFGNLPRASCLKISTPKSLHKKRKSSASSNKNRRVTFSGRSIIIIDDDSFVIGSPDRRIAVQSVPTNFPSDEEDDKSCSNNDSVIELSDDSTMTIETPPNHIRDTIGRTPKTFCGRNIKKSVGSSSPVSPLTKRSLINAGYTPIHTKRRPSSPNSVRSPNTNRKTPVGHASINLRLKFDDSNNSSASDLNKRIHSSERCQLEGSLFMSPNNRNLKSMDKASSKKTKMPDFANIHKKMFDKMLDIGEYSKRKKERAELLLSGKKPEIGSSKKHSDKKQRSDSFKKINSKKKLHYSGEFSDCSTLAVKQNVVKKPRIVSSTPKGVKNEKAGYTRYGFKVPNEVISKKEQMMAVANKTRPPKLKTTVENRNEIKGVRSNRRFDLLMQMRQKKQK